MKRYYWLLWTVALLLLPLMQALASKVDGPP